MTNLSFLGAPKKIEDIWKLPNDFSHPRFHLTSQESWFRSIYNIRTLIMERITDVDGHKPIIRAIHGNVQDLARFFKDDTNFNDSGYKKQTMAYVDGASGQINFYAKRTPGGEFENLSSDFEMSGECAVYCDVSDENMMGKVIVSDLGELLENYQGFDHRQLVEQPGTCVHSGSSSMSSTSSECSQNKDFSNCAAQAATGCYWQLETDKTVPHLEVSEAANAPQQRDEEAEEAIKEADDLEAKVNESELSRKEVDASFLLGEWNNFELCPWRLATEWALNLPVVVRKPSSEFLKVETGSERSNGNTYQVERRKGKKRGYVFTVSETMVPGIVRLERTSVLGYHYAFFSTENQDDKLNNAPK